MVTRNELVVRGSQPEQQGRSEIARRSPDGLSEVSLEFDPEQFQRSFPPLSEVNQPRATFVQNIIINGDYHHGGAKRQRQLQLDNEQRNREDRRERLERQHSIFTLLGFFSYLVILVVIGAMVSGLAMLGMIHH